MAARYQLKVVTDFASAHTLRDYPGACSRMHGHNWKVEAEVMGETLDSIGLLMDFKDLKQIVKDILSELDHKFLNKLEAFKDSNPSSELLGKFIYGQIKPCLPEGVSLVSVSVWESEKACAVYFE